MRLWITLAVLIVSRIAHTEPCTGSASGKRFALCFDNGNRLSLTAGSDGFGGSIAVRHVITFDDEPDLAWKLEHTLLEATHAGFEDRFRGVLYRGRFLRHARDGHIVIPIGTPKKLFLPFDIGAFAEVGSIRWAPDSTIARVGVVKVAALFDLARTRTFRQRIAIGPVVRWEVDVDADHRELAEHIVSPFTSGMLELKRETADGRTVATIALEAGAAWRTQLGWKPDLRAEASLERIVVAVNDRPIALTFGVRYDSETDQTVARIGARIVLIHRRDARISVDPPGT